MRHAITSVIGMTVVLSGPTAWADWPATIASDNPAHWYRFEETSGNVAVDEGSLGVNGTYVGGVGLGECGLVGRAARFDGVDDYVDVGLSIAAAATMTSTTRLFISFAIRDPLQI